MLPIIFLCWAVTMHKLQGVTQNATVVDLGFKLFIKGRAYVAFRRVKSLESLIVFNLHMARLINDPHYKYALTELITFSDLPIPYLKRNKIK
ncbi:hypothetical protein PGB90_002773 [Kerria lacca]